MRALPYAELHRELSARIRRVMPVDAACWHGLDPSTLLLTTASPEELLGEGFLTTDTEPSAAGTVVASEYLRDDFNTFAGLARRRTPVGILSVATRGKPSRSPRWAEYLSKIGTPYEMRAAMVTGHRAWGGVVLHRTQASGDFCPDEARLMARLSRPIAEAIRSSVRLDAARRGHDDSAPGLLVLNGRDEVQLMSARAQELLQPLLRPGQLPGAVPVPVLTLAAKVRSAGRAGRATSPVHLPSRAGWVTLHGSLPDGSGPSTVAVIVQPTTSPPVSARSRFLSRRASTPRASRPGCSSRRGPFRTTSRRSSARPIRTAAASSEQRSSSTTTCRASLPRTASTTTDTSCHTSSDPGAAPERCLAITAKGGLLVHRVRLRPEISDHSALLASGCGPSRGA
jgi:hypothetical protein